MPIGSYFLGLALLALVVWVVARPLLRTARPSPRRGRVPAAPAENVADHKDTLLAIRDLDFDFQTGKVAEEDYTPLRQRLVLEAAARLQAEPATPTAASAEAEIEAAVRSRRDKRPGAESEIEAAVRSRRQKQAAAPTDETCPHCHTPAAAGDRFCARCGTPLGVRSQVAA